MIWALERASREDVSGVLVVASGVLYRSGHLAPADLAETIRRYNLKTVVNLRKDVKFASAGLDEKAWVEERGLRYVYLPAQDVTDPAQVRAFLEIVTRRENQPVLAHCHHGKSRTGVFVAAYRICVEGSSAPKVADEMMKLGASPDFCERHMPLLKTLESADWRSRFSAR